MSCNLKKILFIAPLFFGYWERIKIELEKRGFIVYFINQSLTTQGLVKRYIDRYGNEKQRNKQNYIYYEKKMRRIPCDIDFVFVIKGDSLDEKILEIMRDRYQNAKFIMYQWDSVLNSPNIVQISQYFDRVYSFDRDDCIKYAWVYRPLFFDDNDCHAIKKDYDLSFMCTLKYKRGDIYKQLKQYAAEKGIQLFAYLYCDKKTYIKRFIFDKDIEYKSISIREVKFKSLSLKEIAKIYDKSRVVVDYTTNTQTGLSMRSIECLGHNCKLITNNQSIRFERFYNDDNIYIYNNDIEIPNSFLEKPYKKVDADIIYYYSLKGWLDTIIGGE